SFISRSEPNTEKYLTFIPAWGPNNQYLGAKETMVMAKLLGRTFVPSVFSNHHRVHGIEKTNVRDFEKTFDYDLLSGYVKTKKYEEIASECSHSLDAIVSMKF